MHGYLTKNIWRKILKYEDMTKEDMLDELAHILKKEEEGWDVVNAFNLEEKWEWVKMFVDTCRMQSYLSMHGRLPEEK